MCCEGETFDECCCSSLREKSIFLGCWTLAHSIYLIIMIVIVAEIGISAKSAVPFYIYLIHSLMTLCHLYGAILLLVGVYWRLATVFYLGIIFSSFYPYIHFYMIYLPLVQVLLTIPACRYYKTELKASK